MKVKKRGQKEVVQLDDSSSDEELRSVLKLSYDEACAKVESKEQHNTAVSLQLPVKRIKTDSTRTHNERASRQLHEAAAGARGSAEQSTMLNGEQQEALHCLLVAGLTTKVVGGAGTGKTRVAEAFFEAVQQRDQQRAELLWIAPYNSQVDSAKERFRAMPQLWEALKYGKRIKTVASVFMFPMGGKQNVNSMRA